VRVQISWPRAIGGALIAEVAQVAATFAWVALYSHAINPGQTMATYEAHALRAGPWVSILAGAPIFYLASRWLARSFPTALALFAVFAALDGALLAGMMDHWTVPAAALVAFSYLTKLGACALGGSHVTRR
jgi:hypothetical protein